MPPGHPAVNHEAELAIVIGNREKQVQRRNAAEYIFGFTCMNDVTLGDFSTPGAFGRSPYFVHGKICDGFAPLGPCIVTDLDVGNLRLQCRVNGQIRQDHSTSDRIHEPAELVAAVSDYVTLFPGDVISTGSPPGVQPMLTATSSRSKLEHRHSAQLRAQPSAESRMRSPHRDGRCGTLKPI